MLSESLGSVDAEFIKNFVLTIAGLAALAVCIKTLFFSKTVGIPRPLLVAMEQEFIGRPEYERRHTDIENQVKESRLYSHDEIHAVRSDLQAMKLKGEERDQILHKLDERTITQGGQLRAIDTKIDKNYDRFVDKMEQVVRDGGKRSQT